MSVRYKDLTPEQKDLLTNGCGGKGSWVPIPDWRFTASCDHHDFNYALGGSEEDREKADRQFYDAMLADADAAPWYLRYFYRFWAKTYYLAVSQYAGDYFHYRDYEPTLEELLQEAQEA